jgi:hypothetical protein
VIRPVKVVLKKLLFFSPSFHAANNSKHRSQVDWRGTSEPQMSNKLHLLSRSIRQTGTLQCDWLSATLSRFLADRLLFSQAAL